MSEDLERLIASLNETDIEELMKRVNETDIQALMKSVSEPDIEELMKKYLDSEIKTLELLELKDPKDLGSLDPKYCDVIVTRRENLTRNTRTL